MRLIHTGLFGKVATIPVILMLLAGCTTVSRPHPSPSEHPLTSAEADRLSAIRYRDYDRGVVPVTVKLHVGDQDLSLAGDVDMRKQIGYATFRAAGAESSAGLIQWTMKAVALLPNGAQTLVNPPPSDGWTPRTIDPSASRLDTALAIVLSLSSDRPENPQLLHQNGATYLRNETLRGHRVDIFTGPSTPPTSQGADSSPSRLTYFVDASGLLQRVVVDLAGNQGPLTIDLLDGPGEDISLIPALS